MVNPDLVNWIKSEEAQGFSSEQIYNYLIQQGYNPNDINEALRSVGQQYGQVNQPAQSGPSQQSAQNQPSAANQPNPALQANEVAKPPMNLLPFFIIGLVVVIIIVTGIFLFVIKGISSDSNVVLESSSTTTLISTTTLTSTTTTTTTTLNNAQDKGLNLNCSIFPDKLEACEEYTCYYKHPFTGDIMERHIIGFKADKCDYTEEMPNNGSMECNIPKDSLKRFADFYNLTLSAEDQEFKLSTNLATGETESNYTVGGKEVVDNPLQDALNDGTCIISGYDDLTS